MRSDTRGRILDAAERCFQGNGITATGVDALAEEAGVSKRTLYNHFRSKEEVVTAYLERREARWRDRLAASLAGLENPTDRIVAYIRGYRENDYFDGNRGCPFINAAAELADESHPGLPVIRGSIANIEQGVASILDEAGVEDPDETARWILLVLEGAMSVSGIRRNAEAFDTAERLVRSLVDDRLAATRG